MSLMLARASLVFILSVFEMGNFNKTGWNQKTSGWLEYLESCEIRERQRTCCLLSACCMRVIAVSSTVVTKLQLKVIVGEFCPHKWMQIKCVSLRGERRYLLTVCVFVSVCARACVILLLVSIEPFTVSVADSHSRFHFLLTVHYPH